MNGSRTFQFPAWLLLLALLTPIAGFANITKSNTLWPISMTRVGRTTFEIITRAEFTNSGPGNVINLVATVASNDPGVVIVEDSIYMGSLAAGEARYSGWGETITLRIDRSVTFNASMLAWTFSYDEVGVSGITSDSNELRLELEGGELIVPPAALPAGETVTMTVGDPVLIDPAPNSSLETIITPRYKISFESVVKVAELITLEIAAPPPSDQGMYALVNSKGGFTTEGADSSGWIIELGNYDEARGVYSVSFFATADEILVVIVQRPTDEHAATFPIWPANMADGLLRLATSFLGISDAQAGVPTVPLTSRGWAVRCRQEDFALLEQADCFSDSAKLQMFAQWGYQSAQALASIGFYNADIQIKTYDQLALSGLPFAIYDPDLASVVSNEFFVMEMTPEYAIIASDGSRLDGLYSGTTGLPRFEISVDSTTVIHELFHAVQMDQLADAWPWRLWILEGTAAAIEPLAPGYIGPDGQSFRSGKWRDWGRPANSEEDFDPYRVAELWLAINGLPTYLPTVFQTIQDNLPIDETVEYQLVDQGLADAGEMSLSDSYLAMIQNRDSDSGYTHCGSLVDVLDLDSPREITEVFCFDASCSLNEKLDFDVPPLTAQCFLANVSPPVLENCAIPNNRLQFSGDSLVHRFIVGGVTYSPGDTTPVNTDLKLWVINTGINTVVAPSAAPDAVYISECPPEPGSVRLIEQTIRSSAAARSGGFAGDDGEGEPWHDGESTFMYSYDEAWEEYRGSVAPESYRQKNEFMEFTEGEEIRTTVVTNIAPIGTGTSTLSEDAAIATTGENTGSIGIAASAITVTTSELAGAQGTGMSWSGDSTTSGTFTFSNDFEPPRSSTSNSGGNYTTYFVVEAADADFSLSWSCSLDAILFARWDVYPHEEYVWKGDGVDSCAGLTGSLPPGEYRFTFALGMDTNTIIALSGGVEDGETASAAQSGMAELQITFPASP